MMKKVVLNDLKGTLTTIRRTGAVMVVDTETDIFYLLNLKNRVFSLALQYFGV